MYRLQWRRDLPYQKGVLILEGVISVYGHFLQVGLASMTSIT